MEHLIITHAGSAHFDEMLAVSLILAKYPEQRFRVERREPLASELNDPQIWVVDIGQRFEPELRNFDHHQDLNLPASFVLIGDFLGITEKMRYFSWWSLKDRLDRFGPVKVGEELGIDNFGKLQSPVESWFIDLFAGDPNAARPLLQKLGQNLISLGQRIAKGIDYWSQCRQVEIKGHLVLIGTSEESVGIQEFREQMPRPASACLTYDKRGEGWRLYRFDDCDGVDFSNLSDHPQIKFAHKGGFVAKTHRRLPTEQVLSLLEQGLTSL